MVFLINIQEYFLRKFLIPASSTSPLQGLQTLPSTPDKRIAPVETTGRTLAKAITWQTMGIISMTALSYPHTGSFLEALSIAISASATGFVFFFIHEKVWNHVPWGRRKQLPPVRSALNPQS